jgi:hypothetical protein
VQHGPGDSVEQQRTALAPNADAPGERRRGVAVSLLKAFAAVLRLVQGEQCYAGPVIILTRLAAANCPIAP